MKLASARITNFRSVEDSTEFTLDQVTCLVGKNEAGKTAILKALYGLKPWDTRVDQFQKDRDYPRRYLTDYEERHRNRSRGELLENKGGLRGHSAFSASRAHPLLTNTLKTRAFTP